jgi:phosphoglucosamine mutase
MPRKRRRFLLEELEKQLGIAFIGVGDGDSCLAVRQTAQFLMSAMLFGTDGVRGIAGRPPLTKPQIRQLGAAAARIYREHTRTRHPVFILGRDTRASGPWIAAAFAEGAAAEGARLVDLGVVSTPSIAYLVHKLKASGGVMISASHNPAEFNGIKLFNSRGRKCPDGWERQMEADIVRHPAPAAAKGQVEKNPRALEKYFQFLKSTLPPRFSLKGLTLVIDCSNGSLARIAPAFLRKLGARVIPLGTTPSGRNINAGVGSQHPEKMQKLVRRMKADGGLAFDGDADRIVLCDEEGRLLDGDYVLACVAHVLKTEKKLRGNTVVITVMANLGLLKALEAWDIRVESTAVGDRYVSERLEKKGGMIGGEQSGHIIFHDHLPTGDGLLTGLQILSMLRRLDKPMSWIYSLMQKYPQVLLNVQVKEKKPIDECPDLKKAIAAAEAALARNGRVVVRYSGTEPLLRIMMEGPDENDLRSLAEGVAVQARAALGAA